MKLKTKILKIINLIKVLNKGELYYRFLFNVRKKSKYFERKINLNQKESKAAKIHIFNDKSIFEVSSIQYNYAGKTCDFENYPHENSNSPWYKLNINNFSGDIREYWEFNRLQFLNIILNNYLLTNKIEHVKKINTFLNNWFKYNPLEKGWNHVSNLEIAIRSITFYRLWYYVGDKLDINLADVLFIYGKHLFIDLPRTNRCIPNNHSLGEAVSLLLLAKMFNKKDWEKLAKKTIKKRFDLFTDNGESVEESSGYLLFTTQMLVFLRNLTDEFNDKLNILLPRLFYSLNLLSNKDGTLGLFGDCDDGLFYTFGSLKRNNINQLSLEHFKNNSELNDLFNKSKTINISSSKYLIGLKNNDIKIVLIGGFELMHAHNQCLSFLMWVDEEQVVFSPGTYRYNDVSKEKRRYYNGVSRQNAPRTDSRNNLVTNFRRIKKIKKVKLTKFENKVLGEIIINKTRITREIEIKEHEIVITDKANEQLKPFVVNVGCKIDIVQDGVNIPYIIDLYSPAYGIEKEGQYATINPNGFNSSFSIRC
ncbi:MAG: heparinase II/III family protein [Bacilli bacterium]|jgi:hypothetical protein|nr:heparinase II/III family protein [Bacilli bacterium]